MLFGLLLSVLNKKIDETFRAFSNFYTPRVLLSLYIFDWENNRGAELKLAAFSTNWSIECLLHEYSLSSKLLRTVNLEQTIFIAEIMGTFCATGLCNVCTLDARLDGSNYFIGVEG